MISSVFSRICRWGREGLAMVSTRMEQACWPNWKPGWAMVVMVGWVMREASTLSTPMTDKSSGTRIPKFFAALMVAAAKTSELAKMASGTGSADRACMMAE